jgi:hypothetical protein
MARALPGLVQLPMYIRSRKQGETRLYSLTNLLFLGPPLSTTLFQITYKPVKPAKRLPRMGRADLGLLSLGPHLTTQ